MDLIHYSFVPLILFCVLYMLDLLPYYLSIAIGAGGVGIFELLCISMFCIEVNMKYNTPILVCYSLIVRASHGRFPTNKLVYKTHPSHYTTNKIPV